MKKEAMSWILLIAFAVATLGLGHGFWVIVNSQRRTATALEDIADTLRNVTIGLDTMKYNTTNAAMVTIWRTR